MKTYEKIENNRIIKKINSYVNKLNDNKYNNFEEILENILKKFENIKGFGTLCCYIIASDIASNLNINKTKIYVYHKKILRAIKILNIENIYKIKINKTVFQYVELKDIINGLENINIYYDKNIINKDSKLYDIEKYLYYWQSKI
jgi:hypothetical protein